jgi:Rap1a immunity proteins
MVRFPITALVLLIWATTCASAGTTTGDELLSWCSDKDSPFHQGACDGYINGALDVATLIKSFCAPADVSFGQLREMVLKYLRAKPEVRNLTASYLVGMRPELLPATIKLRHSEYRVE